MSLAASRSELDALKTVDDARQWIGLAPDAWDALDATLGKVPNLRVLALLPPGILQQSVESAIIQQVDGGRPRALNMIEAHQARIMRSLARQKFNLPDEDPLEDLLPAEDETPGPTPLEALPAAPPARPAPAEAPKRPVPQGQRVVAAAPTPVPLQPSSGVSPPLGATFAPPPRPSPSTLHPEDEPWDPRECPKLRHMQMMKSENFYSILRKRGLHLGPRFRAVSMSAGVPGSCYAALRPKRPQKQLQRPSGGPKQDRWWKDYLPGAAPPTAVPPHEDQQRQMPVGRRSRKNLWPGGKIPKDGKGDGLLPDFQASDHEGTGLIVSRELLSGGGLVLPARAGHVPGTAHPVTMKEDEDDCDEPWTYLPGLYDAILTCTFVAANPVPGATTEQLPIPFRIQDFKMLPHVRSTDAYFGHIHPADDTKGVHYCEIYTEEGTSVMDIDGFYPRIQSRPAGETTAAPQAATARGGFQGYIYRTASSSQGRSTSPVPAGGSYSSTTAGSASTRSGSRGSAGRQRSSTPGARRGKRTGAQESGSASLTQAEREEVRERVARWSKYLP